MIADDVLALGAERDHLLAEDVVQVAAGAAGASPVRGSNGAELVEAGRPRRRLGGRVAAALLGEHVHDDRAAEVAGLAQRVLHGLLVVPVDRADVLQAEVLEHAPAGPGRP